MGAPRPVLVVDDDPDVREAVQLVLEGDDHAVVTACHGQEALEALKSSPKPKVILLDLMMPVMSGYEFRQRQLASPELADIPVIIVTAVQEPKLDVHANAYLSKPFDLDVLLKTVRQTAAA